MRTRPVRPLAPLRPYAALVAVVLALLATLAGSGRPASADDIDDHRAKIEKEQRAAEKLHGELESSLEDVSADLQKAVRDLAAIEGRLPAAQQKVDSTQAAYDQAQREEKIIAGRLQDAKDQQATLTGTISADDARAAKIRAAIGEMAREAYRGGTGATTMDVILDAHSTEDFVQRYGMVSTALRTQSQVLDDLQQIDAENKSSAQRLAAVKSSIADLEQQAEEKVTQTDSAKKAAVQAQASLRALYAQQKVKRASLASKRAEAKKQIARNDRASQNLQSDLKQIIAKQRARDERIARKAAAAKKAAEAKRIAAGTSGASKPSGTISGAVFSNPTSISPIYVTSEYGIRYDPVVHVTRLHAGIDLRTWCDTPEYAPRAGTVVWAKYVYGLGNQVMINYGYVDGNSLMSSSNHMTRSVVHAGQHVSDGQLIGYSGSTGDSMACHLHFEVYVNGSTVNPRPFLGLPPA